MGYSTRTKSERYKYHTRNQRKRQIIELLENADDGMTCYGLAHEMNVSSSYVYRLMVELHEEGRVVGEERYHRPNFTKWVFTLVEED